MLTNLLNDIRFCLRGFARRPLFAGVVVATLALGLGINAAMFSIYNQVLLRDLPVAAPDELVNFLGPGLKQGSVSCTDIGSCEEVFSYPMFRDLERFDGPFVGIAAHRNIDANLAVDGNTAAGRGVLVSGSYFPLLGLTAARGRLLDANDDAVPGEASTVVLSYAYWQSAFAEDPSVIGRELFVNGKPLMIVGVAPRGFRGTTLSAPPQVFLPITFRWLADTNSVPNHTDRKSYWAYLFARLKPGVSLPQAAAAINGRYQALINELDAPLLTDLSEQQVAEFRANTLSLEAGAHGQSAADFYARNPLTILLVSTGLVLLIASVNVANLLLARGATRVGEIAVRASLGASAPRLLALLLVEVALLATGAALVSLPLTLAALHGVHALLPPAVAATFDLALDGTVIATTVAFAVISTLVFGLTPTLKLVRANRNPTPRTQSVRSTGGKNAARFRAALATVQIALSVALLVLAGWFAQSLANVTRVDLGFTADSLSVFSIAPERNGYTPQRSAALFQRLEEELAQVPGVTSTATAWIPLAGDASWGYNVIVEGYDAGPNENMNIRINYVSPSFFRTVEMPLVTGSEFELGQSADRPRAAIVNERFAARFRLGADAVGRRVTADIDPPFEMEIVGIARDAKYSDVKDDPPAQLFMPRQQAPFLGNMSFYLRSGMPALDLRGAVEQVLARHDRNLPLMDFRTVREMVKENVFVDRFMSTLGAALAVIATVLAGIGIYGVLSYGVAQRLREIGLRIALGATPQTVRGMVLKQVVAMAGIGGVVGVSLALALGQVARALLFGLTPTDPFVPALAVIALTTVVLAAAYWPARRAARVDPVTALRSE
jgi:predicted permease